VGATITIVSTAKRGTTSAFDERHDGTISTEFKLTWNARGARQALEKPEEPLELPPP